MKKQRTYSLIMVLALCSLLAMSAQERKSSWFWGFTEGVYMGNVRFSNLNTEHMNSFSTVPSASLFIQGEFGNKRQLGLRQEVVYMQRGGYLMNYDIDDIDADYLLKANYVDFRLSLMYNFCKATSMFRPYLFVSPRVGVATGGQMRLEHEEKEVYGGMQTRLTEGNMAKTNFSVAPGIGLRWNFRAGKQGQNLCHFGVEAGYEFGISNTYGEKEKKGTANNLLDGLKYKAEGKRRFSGIEVKAVLALPFSVFKKSKPLPEPVPEPVIVEKIVVKEQPKEEKLCYTLEEIIEMMDDGQNIAGKTICAIDAISFAFNKSSISKESFPYLDKLAETLKRTSARIQVKGHSDNVGSEEANLRLSKERAQEVMNYLLKKGVDRGKLSYDYYGSSRPLVSNETEEGRTINRRVEFEILK